MICFLRFCNIGGMLHVCLMIGDLVDGGVERLVVGIAGEHCKRGHRVDPALFGYANACPDELDDRISIFVFACQPGRLETMRRRRKAYPGLELPGRAPTSETRRFQAGTAGGSYIEDRKPDIVFTNL